MSKGQKLLTQTAFDEAVVENILDLEMPPDEAVEDAKKQFEIQGFDLSTIITDLYLTVDVEKLGEDRIANRPKHKIVCVIDKLRAAAASDWQSAHAASLEIRSHLVDVLNAVAALCSQHPGNRFLAFEARFEASFVQLTRPFADDAQLISAHSAFLRILLQTFALFAKAQAPLLSADTLRLLVTVIERVRAFDPNTDKLAATDRQALLAVALRCAAITCEFSESNKATLCAAGACRFAVEALEICVSEYAAEAIDAIETVTSVCTFIGALMKQDDVNAIEQTQERALDLVERGAIRLLVEVARLRFEHLNTDKSEQSSAGSKLLSLLFGTLANLCIRSEYCEQVASCGALVLAFSCLSWCLPSDSAFTPAADIETRLRVLNGCLVLLRALSANDSVKAQIVADCPLAFTILIHLADVFGERCTVCGAAFALLGTLCLRSPTHVRVLMERCGELNVADSAIRALQLHLSRAHTAKSANSKADLSASCKTITYICTFVRNAVARNREYCDAFLQRAADGSAQKAVPTELEFSLNEALALQPSDAELIDAAKAALRDLGCRVDLRECWTGKHAEIPR